jgi:hypothetical protein
MVDLKLEPREELKAAPIVLNAGLYNVFLTAGLIWGILKSRHGFTVRVFCLTCAIVAGLFGALTLTPKTVLLQSVPAALALAAVLRTRSIEEKSCQQVRSFARAPARAGARSGRLGPRTLKQRPSAPQLGPRACVAAVLPIAKNLTITARVGDVETA